MERKHCTGTHRNWIGWIHNGVRLRAVRPLPLEFPRGSCGPLGDSFLPRDFLALESFGGRYISRNCKKQRGNEEARQKFWKKGRRTLCARFVLLSSYNFLRAAWTFLSSYSDNFSTLFHSPIVPTSKSISKFIFRHSKIRWLNNWTFP